MTDPTEVGAGVLLGVDDETDVARVTVDRPDRLNALDAAALEALDDALEEAEAAGARALVVAGAGDEAFVAGADIGAMKEMDTPEALAYAELGHEVFGRLERFRAPTLAAVDGYAFGGGCELALACDLRVASERALLGQTEVDLGIIPGWGATQRLPAVVGDETARRMIYLGERLDAETALDRGLVGEVVAPGEFEGRVTELAETLAAQPHHAVRAAKEALHAARGDLSGGLAHERRAWSGLFGTHDQREGMAAFLEDREPDFD